MKVLVIGGGGREHALAWKVAQSPLVQEVLVAPGNAGTATEAKVRNAVVAAEDIDGLIELAQHEAVGLTIVGPEPPLVAGVVDRFQAQGLKCFGPGADGARLEGSKAFTKTFLERHRIPTAGYRNFTELAPAVAYVRTRPVPIVIKADGLAAGKGVIIARSLVEAEEALKSMLEHERFGAAGATVVIEDYLEGEEASFIAMVDGTQVLPLASSQDHKTRDDGDRGPNTGGMGAYSPAPVVTDRVHDRIMDQIMLPTVRGLAADGIHYRGFLYAGLMIDSLGRPKVIEFNCRLGDPETQPILFRLRSDLVALCLASFDGTLGRATIDWDRRAAVGVVMASRGYPGNYDKGKPIRGLDQVTDEDVKVFHAGTRLSDGEVLSDGGRVLCAVALGTSVREARDRAYAQVDKISWEGAFWRSDIGHRAVQREQSSDT
ncbi:MAG TPA: phosphoribosylamine--glycine ligase [Gammaproteobacteria bacterium]|nr:phosphoribosylamine--glycine ligase [Gammaproteobacteria bacterium]